MNSNLKIRSNAILIIIKIFLSIALLISYALLFIACAGIDIPNIFWG